MITAGGREGEGVLEAIQVQILKVLQLQAAMKEELKQIAKREACSVCLTRA